jgi:hypothetical protein
MKQVEYIPTSVIFNTIATFADDTAIMALGDNIEEATDRLQQAINVVNSWTKQWRIILRCPICTLVKAIL